MAVPPRRATEQTGIFVNFAENIYIYKFNF